ncbi:MAG: iron-containing alcohol dehydrogenase [Treponema sp.]|jgi:alcohol dehydrogenase class IV|nr:iron-containing alcohol dehydrogenase [Treponema sp.]
MRIDYFMPTRVVMGENCVFENRELFAGLGKKALLVTGRKSAKLSGAQADVEKALAANGQARALYDKVMSNPSVECIREIASVIAAEQCNFVIAIGGGSPLDAGKAAAALACAPETESAALFSTSFTSALPIVAIPSTAGTGSEVTRNAVLTNHQAKTKASMAGPAMFPRCAFLDARYLSTLSLSTTINTAVDALSHAIEGMLSMRASLFSDILAKESIALIAKCYRRGDLERQTREELLSASTLAGMVITNAGTVAVHAMGYMLTYNRNIDHGRTAELLLGEFLRFAQKTEQSKHAGRINEILTSLNMRSLDEFCAVLDTLFRASGPRERFERSELEAYAAQAVTAKNITNGIVKPSEQDIFDIFVKSLM